MVVYRFRKRKNGKHEALLFEREIRKKLEFQKFMVFILIGGTYLPVNFYEEICKFAGIKNNTSIYNGLFNIYLYKNQRICFLVHKCTYLLIKTYRTKTPKM
jgi:hypothetical protein